MHLRDKIQAYTKFGGAWKHLEEELIKTGFSNTLASTYVSKISRELSNKNSHNALLVYDHWVQTKNEETTTTYMNLQLN